MRNISFLVLLLFIIQACSGNNESTSGNSAITANEIEAHIRFLASDSLKGREAGSPGEAIAANYLADRFRDYGLEPAGEEDTYFQDFTINKAAINNPHASADGNEAAGEDRIRSRNVAALLQGTETGEDEELIIIAAHYDHLGMGDFGSLYSGEPRIHNGADDNASGTAGLLELAQYFADNRPQTDLLFLAVSGEEMGLLGSQYYVENPTVDLNHAVAMINMDMIGRMSNDRLMIFGTGTAAAWDSLLSTANSDSLDLELVTDGTGSSDHTSFYYKNIPVLHYFTDTHADYHRPSDDTDYINAEGEALALSHLSRVVQLLDEMDRDDMTFIASPGEQRQRMTLDGPTLGVLPDYGYEGEGMRITGVNEGGAADNAGLQSGDVIIAIAGEELADIYAYMGALNKLEKGQLTTITVLRDGREMTMDLQL